MRVALSWLREVVAIPASADAHDVADHLIRSGFEVDSIETQGAVSGPLVVGEVVDFDEEPQKNGKTIRWCQVRVAPGAEPRGIVCGALNFAVGDRVAVALPGAVLPGGFEIGARKTYGHVSDGMICSARELGIGTDHTGILVLDPAAEVGADAAQLLGLGDDILDISPTPDRGYAMSVRGIARELAGSYRVPFDDPADAVKVTPSSADAGWPVRLDDPSGCDRFVAHAVRGLDPQRPSPEWMQRRLQTAGVRSVSLAVDVTNYVMLELGQPLHAYDLAKVRGPIVVRRARAGERLRTLDDADRELNPDDLVIADDTGVIGLAGVMGGASTEVSSVTSELLLEGAHFTSSVISRSARRHGLLSEASRRFERGIDPAVGPVAVQRAVDLLVEFGGVTPDASTTDVGTPAAPPSVRIRASLPAEVMGVGYRLDEVLESLAAIGCVVNSVGDDLVVHVPTWRPDLRDPFDLVEEVARLVGYDRIPSVLPVPPPSGGLDEAQRARRRIGRALADAGYVETPSYPFIGDVDLDALGLATDDPRRQTVRLANPISDEQPALRTTLLPGLLSALRRNIARGNVDLALFETGLVFRLDDAPGGRLPPPPRLPVDRRPTDDQLAALDAALPRQPRRLAVALAGERERSGWWGSGRRAEWGDAVEAARLVAREAGVQLEVEADDHAPWHPGRCAALRVDGVLVGHAGELHPRVVESLGLPPRTVAAELDLDGIVGAAHGLPLAPTLSTYPLASSDVALVVPAGVPAAGVEAALRIGAGPFLESVRLFDVYVGPGVPEGSRSLAYRLSMRAPDHTLTADEANAIRDAAVAEAGRRVGATLRT
ncbi:MAG: phenylalanyl-tRNA synthetase beta chain [Actinomycetota bacterium]|nr:phenylalanyl-tRNA synthetase beta chain [Actinomycetota bacterium]